LSGAAIGINIARASRVSSYAIPASIVRQLVEQWLPGDETHAATQQ
jgi:hypothetical protein